MRPVFLATPLLWVPGRSGPIGFAQRRDGRESWARGTSQPAAHNRPAASFAPLIGFLESAAYRNIDWTLLQYEEKIKANLLTPNSGKSPLVGCAPEISLTDILLSVYSVDYCMYKGNQSSGISPVHWVFSPLFTECAPPPCAINWKFWHNPFQTAGTRSTL